MDWTADGLWIIGVGAFCSALPRLMRAPRPQLGLAWESLASRVDRVHFAVESVGWSLVAVGSTVLALVELPVWWFALAVLLSAGIAVWVVAAAKRHQLYVMRAANAEDYGRADPPIASVTEQRSAALHEARWSTCLRRALAPTPPWPPTRVRSASCDAGAHARLEPRHIEQLHERDARLEDAHIPPAISADVAAIRSQGFKVFVSGDALIAMAPDGRSAQVSRSAVGPNSTVAVLTRQRFLDDLAKLGLEVWPGAKGQPRVAGDIEWRLPDRSAP